MNLDLEYCRSCKTLKHVYYKEAKNSECTHLGRYCRTCGTWIKWISKEEQNEMNYEIQKPKTLF